jgi:hypothetical protein
MKLGSLFGPQPSAAHVAEGEIADLLATEAIELVDATEFPFHFVGPARGILNGVVIGSGAWMIIFTTVALTRAIFFG